VALGRKQFSLDERCTHGVASQSAESIKAQGLQAYKPDAKFRQTVHKTVGSSACTSPCGNYPPKPERFQNLFIYFWSALLPWLAGTLWGWHI
jgi:hypothetical protein